MHPSVGIGRGAPEIDALEASVDMNIGLGWLLSHIKLWVFYVLYAAA